MYNETGPITIPDAPPLPEGVNPSRLGHIPHRLNLDELAARRYHRTPRVLLLARRVLLGCSALCILSAVIAISSLLTQPRPLLLVSYPDGTIRCAPPSVDLATGQPHQRSREEAGICQALDLRIGQRYHGTFGTPGMSQR